MTSAPKRKIGYFLLTLAVPILSIRCSEVGFSGGDSPSNVIPPTTVVSPPGGPGTDITSINQACDTGTVIEQTVPVNFANPGVQCDWGVGDNLSIRNSYFQAERTQPRNLGLPANAILCDAEFEFARDEEFWFDDVFILSLNDNILVSSYNFDEYLPEENGFFRLDWSQLKGKFWDEARKSQDYCVGKDEGLASCTFPSQHEFRPMEVQLSPEIIRTAMLNSRAQDHQVKLTILGDNDTSDCQHYDMSFEMKVKYVVP